MQEREIEIELENFGLEKCHKCGCAEYIGKVSSPFLISVKLIDGKPYVYISEFDDGSIEITLNCLECGHKVEVL